MISITKVLDRLIKGNQYSTSETKTGKVWIDGKPIYRKVYQGTDGTPVGTLDRNLTTANVDSIVSWGGFYTAYGNRYAIPYVDGSSYWVRLIVDTEQVLIAGKLDTAYGKWAIIFEYTKTTD